MSAWLGLRRSAWTGLAARTRILWRERRLGPNPGHLEVMGHQTRSSRRPLRSSGTQAVISRTSPPSGSTCWGAGGTTEHEARHGGSTDEGFVTGSLAKPGGQPDYEAKKQCEYYRINSGDYGGSDDAADAEQLPSEAGPRAAFLPTT